MRPVSALVASFLVVSSFPPSAVADPESFEVWHKASGIQAKNPYKCVVPFGPTGIVFADRVVRKDELHKPLDLDLVLRNIPGLSTPGKAPILATVLSVKGDVPRSALQSIQISSVEIFHGKLYVGIYATDPHDNGDGTVGTDDTYRRRLYVSESIKQGEGVSRQFKAASLEGAELEIRGILPGSPGIVSSQGQPKPTTIEVLLRSAVTSGELTSAVFVGPDGKEGTAFPLADGKGSKHKVSLPSGHKWVQYKIRMSTSDARVTPVLEQVKLVTPGETIIDDVEWSGGQLPQQDGLDPSHSPGEVVLANRKLADQTLSMIQVLQPPGKKPPAWTYSILGDGRAFSESRWPYQAVGDMEPFQGKLYLLVGPTVSFHTGCRAGDLVSYDYRSGLFKIEAHHYHGGDPSTPGELTLWGEGAGKIMTFGDMLVAGQPDTKVGVWNGQAFGHSEGIEYYMYSDGSGAWKLGFVPDVVNGAKPLHLHDLVHYGGHQIASTNRGMVSRAVPSTESEHRSTSTWTYLGFGPHPGSIDPSMASGGFAVFDRHLISAISISGKDASQNWYNEKKLVVFGSNLTSVFEKDIVSDPAIAQGIQEQIEYRGRLVLWNGADLLYYTNPRLYLTPPTASLSWTKGTSVSSEIPVEGGKAPLKWQLAGGKLPSGVVLDPAKGSLSGAPEQEGAFDAVIKVSDSNSPQAESTVRYSIVVTASGVSSKDQGVVADQTSDAGGPSPTDDGCGCHLGGAVEEEVPLWLILVLFVGIALVRSRLRGQDSGANASHESVNSR